MTETAAPVPRFETVAAALRSLGGQARPAEIAEEIRRIYPGPHPRTLLNSVRGRLQECSSDSKLYQGRNDLFYSVHGIGGGVWGLREMVTSNEAMSPPSAGEPADDPLARLETAIRYLEDGGQPVYGGLAEIRMRKALQADVAQAKEELAPLAPRHGCIGHNQPPDDEQLGVASSSLASQTIQKMEIIETELSEASPDALKVAKSAHWLRLFTHWLAKNADSFSTEFSKALGKSLGKSIGIALPTGALIIALNKISVSAVSWLELVLP